MLRRDSRWIVLIVVLVTQVTTARNAARADDNNKSCLVPETSGCTFGLPTFQYQLLLGEMMAHPTPDVRQLVVDEDELGHIARYRVVGGTAPLYDAPDGNAVDVIDTGFDYITVRRREGDWFEIIPGRWMRAQNLTMTSSSSFAGVLIDEPLAYPMGWVLLPTRPSAVPGTKPDPNTPMLDRYARVNIFATVTVGDWNWYLVGPGQWLEQRRVARVLPVNRPVGVKGRWVSVDLYEQVLVAYEDDQMVFATMISSGLPRPQWGTNKGLFRIWARMTSTRMSGAFGRPDYYNLPDVPWVMYFDHAIALHGAYWHDGFGFRHSHGCVNMSVTDAHWLYDWTSGFYADAWVYVYSSGEGPKPTG
jgi:hypothetical protein